MLSATRRSVIQGAGLLLLAVVSVGCARLRGATAQPPPVGPPGVQAATLRGTVVGPDGQPVPEAQVGVTGPKVGGQTLDGLFGSKCNPAGEFEVVTQYYGPQAACCILARSADGTLMGAAASGEFGTAVQIRLQPSGYIHSSILDPEGSPVAGIGTVVIVRADHVPGPVKGPQTDERGEVLIGPLPAGLPVFVGVAGLGHLVPQDTWGATQQLQPGATYELPTLVLDPDGRSVEGTLEDADGKPLPGAQVACYLPQQPLNVATADEQGHFTLTRLPVQGYDVWLIAGDTTKRLYVMAPVNPDAGDKARLVLRPLTSAFGVLRGPDGQALADVPVRVYPRLQGQRQGAVAYLTWGTKWAPRPELVETGNDGSWEITGLIAGGMYRLTPELAGIRLNADTALFEVDREGRPTDVGLMVMR